MDMGRNISHYSSISDTAQSFGWTTHIWLGIILILDASLFYASYFTLDLHYGTAGARRNTINLMTFGRRHTSIVGRIILLSHNRLMDKWKGERPGSVLPLPFSSHSTGKSVMDRTQPIRNFNSF